MPNYLKRSTILAVSLVIFLFDRLCDCLKSFQKENKAVCVILYYHGIDPKYAGKFARQMQDLIRWVKPISLDQISSFKAAGNYCAVTFDDGLISVSEYALPVMANFKIPAALFIPSACLGQPPPWIHSMERGADVVMTVSQLQGLDRKLVLIGSHGRFHKNLLGVSREEAEKEIVESKRELEAVLNRPVVSISFPHGAFNRSHLDMVSMAGYQHAFTILPERVNLSSAAFLMGRVKVDPYDWRIEFLLKVFGAYRWLPVGFVIKRKLYSYFRK
jgi:peptidoglycan/xylan/chitin deacetylase (PgdA/CDA1 family)